MANQETLLSPSNVLLYGRIVKDLRLVPPVEQASKDGGKAAKERTKDAGEPPLEPPRLGANKFLEHQLQAKDAKLARIYGFSYDGHYYDLTSPTIFLVHGDGVDPQVPRPAPPRERVSRAPANADLTGVAGMTGTFSEDMKVWAYDKGDFTIRMDIATGPFEEMLLEAELVAEDMQAHYSGQRVRASGQRVRASGQRVRASGQRVRGPGGGGLGD